MKKLNLFLIIVAFLLGNHFLFSQAADRLYLSTASTGRVYDITDGASPILITIPNSSGTPRNISNLAVGYDQPGGNPSTLVFINSNTAAGSTLYKNGTAISGTTIPAGVRIGGIATNNVPGAYFGNVYGFKSNTKTLYPIYPSGTAILITSTDTDWNDGTTFGTDTFFDYQNNIYTFINNGSNRYLFKISIATGVAEKAISAPISGSASFANLPTSRGIQGMAYLQGFVYIASINATNNDIEIRRININDGTSILSATYTSSSYSYLDLATVPYYVPFTLTCSGITQSPTTPFVEGVASNGVRSLNIPITNVYGPGTYTINIIGENFNSSSTVNITSSTTSINVPLVYDGGGSSGTRTLSVNLNGSSTACNVNVLVDEDTDGDGIGNSEDLDDDNDGILDTDENSCITSSKVEGTPIFINDFGTGATTTDPYVLNHTYTTGDADDDGFYNVRTSGTTGVTYTRTNLTGDKDAGNPTITNGTTTGRYLMINVDSPNNTNKAIYRVTGINTQVGQSYRFRIDMAGLAEGSADIPNLKIAIKDASNNELASANSSSLGMANDDVWRRLNLEFTATTSSVTLEIINEQATGNSGNDVGIDNIVFTPLFCDADNDGTPNQLDLDSDNDGCPDAIEGDENVTTSQLTANRISGTVNANGVPNLVNSGGAADIGGDQGQGAGQAYTVNPAAVGGTASSNQTIVSGATPAALSLSGHTGTIQWQSSTDNVTFTNISGATSATYAPGALTATTYYRAVLTSAGGCTANSTTVTINIDSDGDGVPDYQDLDSDNDGILDIFECPQSVVDVNFSVANGNSQTFSAPAADLGFIFDVYRLDNSFTLTVNGASISSSKLEFQPDQTDNVRFMDGSRYGNGGIPQIWAMTGTAANPLVRLIIHKNGAISMYGSKTSGGPLFPLQLYNGNNFNTIIWNQTSTNTVVVSQVVVGATHISGRGIGVRNGFCDPDNDGISNQFDVDSDNDGCADAIEGSENVKYNQIHDLNLPLADPNYAYRGQIKVTYNGTTTSTPSGIISNSPSANGVPQLLNNAGNNLNASTNPSNLAGAVDNTDGTADIGQGIGDSQNIMVNSCAVPFICDTNMYVVQGNPSVLYRIDTSTNPFNFVQIGTGATYPVNATGYNPTDNFIYGINGGANVDKSLIRIDANGTFYNLGVISGLDIAMSYTSGEMDELGNYYIKLAGQNNNKLYKVDVATRTATLIQLSRNVSFIDIAYTQTDGLLWAQDTVSKKLVSINPTNGLVTDLPFVNTLNNYGAWFGSGTGQIYASSNDGTAFVEFNKTTGEAMFISTTQPSTNNDGAHCPTAPIKFDLYCSKLPVTNAGTQLPSNHGITALGRAGADNSNWPMVRQSAWTVLEAKTKGFVVNRVANPATDIANPVEGMMVFDTTAQCLKIYNGTVWSCYSTPACP